MYYPATRLLSVLELLRSHGRMSGAELAEQLEVDSRTVRRYVTMLQDLGMPIESERGRAGGYQLKPNYRLPPIIFSEDEALALTLGVLFAGRLGLTGTIKAAESAIAKMERVMPATLRDQVRMMDETLVMRSSLPNNAPASEILLTLSIAAYRNRRVWRHYRKYNVEEPPRQVDPYAIVHTLGFWYLAGYCHLRQDLRIFRIDRVLQVTMCEDTFQPPEQFDALEYVENSIANTPWGTPCEVLLETTMAEAKRLMAPAGAVLEQVAEGVVLKSFVYEIHSFAHFLLGLSCPLVIRSPDLLRDTMRELAAKAQRLASRYENSQLRAATGSAGKY